MNHIKSNIIKKTIMYVSVFLIIIQTANSLLFQESYSQVFELDQRSDNNNEYLFVNVDMAKKGIFLTNQDDVLVFVPLDNTWVGGPPLHSLILPDGDKLYVSTIGSENEPSTILVMQINNIDWENKLADVEIIKSIIVEEKGTMSQFPDIANHTMDDTQPVLKSLWFPGGVQLHGPTVHPDGKYVYFTQWTDDKIHVIDTTTDELVPGLDPIQYDDFTNQIHGVFFNADGTKALAPGYFFDLNYVVLFDVNSATGNLINPQKIILGDTTNYAAFPHFVTWINNTHAFTSTQQLGPTSVTTSGSTVIGPSVWLIDTENQEATMIIGPTDNPNGEGIYKPGSDTAVVDENKLLFVAEEDSMDLEIDSDGYVSIWDISDINSPILVDRLSPGEELPEGFELGHSVYPTPDGKYVYVQSWHSGHWIKIDAENNDVVNVFDGPNHGLEMPHGGFIAGNMR